MIFNVLIGALAVFAYILVGRVIFAAFCRYDTFRKEEDAEAVAMLWPISLPFALLWKTAERVVYSIVKRLGWDD